MLARVEGAGLQEDRALIMSFEGILKNIFAALCAIALWAATGNWLLAMAAYCALIAMSL